MPAARVSPVPSARMGAAGNPAKAQEAGGFRPAHEGVEMGMRTVEEIDRAYQSAATSTITSSASSVAVIVTAASSRMAMPSRACAAAPFTDTAPRAGTR